MPEVGRDICRQSAGVQTPVGEVEDDVGERVAGAAFEGPGLRQAAQPGTPQSFGHLLVQGQPAAALGVEHAQAAVRFLLGRPPASGAGHRGGGVFVAGVAQTGRRERGVDLQGVGGEGFETLDVEEQRAVTGLLPCEGQQVGGGGVPGVGRVGVTADAHAHLGQLAEGFPTGVHVAVSGQRRAVVETELVAVAGDPGECGPSPVPHGAGRRAGVGRRAGAGRHRAAPARRS